MEANKQTNRYQRARVGLIKQLCFCKAPIFMQMPHSAQNVSYFTQPPTHSPYTHTLEELKCPVVDIN